MAQLANLTGKRIYLDTNIIIYSVEPANLSDQLYATVQAILNLANTDQIVLATSEFTLAEVLVRPFAANNQNLVDTYSRLISVNGPFLLQSMTRQVMIAAANIRAQNTKIRTPDALHIAAAIDAGCEAFLTRDHDLIAAMPQLAHLELFNLDDF